VQVALAFSQWRFREWHQPFETAKPLEFGIAFHKGMEVLYQPDTWDWDREVVGELAVKTFVDTCNKQREAFLRDNNEPALEPAAQEDYDERVELGMGMLRYYYREQLPKYPEGFRPVKVEIPFEVPVPHPDTGEQIHCKCENCWIQSGKGKPKPSYYAADPYYDSWQGLPVVYSGRIDALMQDADGWLFPVDWKTTIRVSQDDEFLELDCQVASYSWALKVLGLPVRGFVYHEQKKGYPQPPAMNKHVRLGCSFSVNKNADTDYRTYLQTVREQDPQAYAAGYYDKHLEWLKSNGPTFFKRWFITKSDTELDNIGKDIGRFALDMTDPNLRIYPSPGRFSCQFCLYRQPCLGRMRGEDVDYYFKTCMKREAPYYMRQTHGPSTDSRGGE
jgi:hypothetical protein